MMLLLINQLK